jgi:S1-C subfamily serine protease
MALDEKYRLTLERAQRALGHNSPVDAVKKVRAIIGPRNIPNSEAEAQSALESLHKGEIPTPEQLTALEIVVRLMRPVVFSRNGELEDLPETPNQDLRPTELKDAWSSFKAIVRPYVGSIGRVEDAAGNHVGTGFVVGTGMIATNRHVLSVLTSGSEAFAPNSARIVFRQEIGQANRDGDTVLIARVVKVHPTLDMVLLGAEIGTRQPLPLSDVQPMPGERVAAIGYPGKDEANNPLFLTSVFDGKFGMKRAAIGEVLDGTEQPNVFHDCSTTQGNSGSPVFLISSGKVAGIHRSGYFMYRNEAVMASELDRLGR